MLKKKDFIEIEFTGRIKGGEIFDSNVEEDLKKANLKIPPKPFIFSLGQGMFLESIDEFLIGKDLGSYNIELSPEKAFGLRDKNMIKIVSAKVFKNQNMSPFPGMVVNFDGRIAKVISVSGGRITIDFNNPIAGKIVVYDINVKRKIGDTNEKAKSFINFLYGKDFEFKVDGKKLTIEAEKNIVKFVELFKDKFKEVLELDLEVVEMKEKETKNPEVKQPPQ